MSKTKQIAKTKKGNSKRKDSSLVVSGNELSNLIKIVVIVCAVLLIFYFITLLVNRKDDEIEYRENTTPTIQYNKILVGEILNRQETAYYVLVEKENDQYVELYNYYLSNYSGNDKNLKYYTVDLSDVFNGNHIGEQTIVGENTSEYKFADTTLIKVQEGEVAEIYKDRNSITSYLENLKY